MPEQSIRAIYSPVLFLHGDSDILIPQYYAQRNFDACGSAKKYIHIIENAHHQDLGDQGGVIYREIVPAFFRENMRDSG
jgi:fermentation-respiration switch protein FrsA (DUF1100 family)